MVVHEADFGGHLRNGFERERDEGCQVASEASERNTESGEVLGVERAFVRTACDGDDAAEGGGVA